MEETNTKPKRVVRISRRKFMLGLILVIIAFFAYNSYRQNRSYDIGVGIREEMPPMGTSGSSQGNLPSVPERDYSYPNYGGQPDITDTREFLKTNYSAQIKTRDVSDIVKDVKGAVRDVEGRVDSSQISERFGHISFVVPKSRFEEFRDQIESLTHEKLYTENISSENLLSQKQSIEEQDAAAKKYLATLEQQKKDQDAKHAQVLAALKRELENTQIQLVATRQSKGAATDQNQIAVYQNQENSLTSQEAEIKRREAEENRLYAARNETIKANIAQANQGVASVAKQDEQFTDNIETVNGSVAVRFTNTWEMAEIFSPIHPAIIIVVLIIVLLYLGMRKNYIPGVEFV
jgi:hypothetical protein